MVDIKNKSLLFNRKAVSLSLFSLVLAFVLIISIYFAFAAAFSPPVITPGNFNFNEDNFYTYSILVNNTDSALNITYLNITLPSGLVFQSFSNLTSSYDYSPLEKFFANTSDALSWNATYDLLITNYNFSTFTFNLSAQTPGTYGLNVTSLYSDSTTYLTVITVTINDTTAPTGIELSNSLIDSLISGGNYSSSKLINISVLDNINVTYLYFNFTNVSGTQVLILNSSRMGSSWNATLDTTTLSDGFYNITVYANDFAGNSNNTVILSEVGFDNSFPRVDINYPLARGNYSGNLLINSSINDSFSIHNVYYNITNSSGQLDVLIASQMGSSWNATLDTTTLSDGFYNITVYANDSASNINSTEKILNFFVDNSAPLLTVISPLNNSNSSNSGQDILYSVSDYLLDSCWYTNDSLDNVSLPGCNNLTSLVWDEGIHHISIFANDSFGHANFSHLTFNIDTNKPRVNITSPISLGNYSRNLLINSTVTGINFSISYVSYNISNLTYSILIVASQMGSSWNATLDTTTLSDGFYNITVYANDSIGNSNNTEKILNFLVDNAHPLVSISSPINTTYNNDSLSFRVNLSEQGFVRYTLDSGTNNYTMSSSNGLIFNATNSSLGEGSYILRIYANDSAGNTNYTEFVVFGINYNYTPPSVSINSPTETTYSSNTVSISINISENGTCLYSLDGGITNNSLSTIDNMAFAGTSVSLSNGDYTLDAYCNDSAGNMNSTESVSFVVSVTSSGGHGGGGGGGGGGSIVSKWVKDIKVNDSEINLGQVLKQLKKNYRLTFNVNGIGHSLGLLNLTNKSATIELASTPQIVTLLVGESKKFDLDLNGYYDLIVSLNSIYNQDANFSIKVTNELISKPSSQINNSVSDEIPNNSSSVSNNSTNVDNSFEGSKINSNIWRYIIIVILISIIIYIISLISQAIKASNTKSDAEIVRRIASLETKKS